MFTGTQTWLESSLQRSASLGLEVLERASRRNVDWTSTRATQMPSATYEEVPVQRAHTELDVFATIADLMAQTAYQCKRFYESDCCTEPTDTERRHVSRFHTWPVAATTPALSTRESSRSPHDEGHVSSVDEDLFFEVSPGTYAVTAITPYMQKQIHVVRVEEGESIDVTFNL